MDKRTSDHKQWQPTWKDIILYVLLGILFIGQIVLCFTSYNGAGLDYVLDIGWVVFAFSMVLGMLPRRAFQTKGKAPTDKSWIHTSVVVAVYMPLSDTLCI